MGVNQNQISGIEIIIGGLSGKSKDVVTTAVYEYLVKDCFPDRKEKLRTIPEFESLCQYFGLEAIGAYERQGMINEAVRLAGECGQIPRAIQMLSKSSEYHNLYRAAELARSSGDKVSLETICNRAISLFLGERALLAARFADLKGDNVMASQIRADDIQKRLINEDFNEVHSLASESKDEETLNKLAGLVLRKSQSFIDNGDYTGAYEFSKGLLFTFQLSVNGIPLYEHQNLGQDKIIRASIEYYSSRGRFKEAARLAESGKYMAKASELYYKAGDPKKALELLMVCNPRPSDPGVWERIGVFRDAGRAYDQEGNEVMAKNMRDWVDAIEWKINYQRTKEITDLRTRVEATSRLINNRPYLLRDAYY